MSTYVLRFFGATPDEFRGRVRHVGTGEEHTFASSDELCDFLEHMNAAHGLQPTVIAGAEELGDSGGTDEK